MKLTGQQKFCLEVCIRIALWCIYFKLSWTLPFMRHIEQEEMWMYRYPSIHSYFPQWCLWLFLFIIPAVLFLGEYIVKRNGPEILECISALTLATPLNGVVTQLLKIGVGRPRPNFFLRCFPDGYGTSIENCTGDYHSIMNGRKSFPSLHTTFAFNTCIFLTMHLFHATRIRTTRILTGRGWKYVICTIPMYCACLIGISRTCDYHHHYSDVIGGVIIGSIMGSTIYWAYCPNPEDIDELDELSKSMRIVGF